jgi:hypothetical protein
MRRMGLRRAMGCCWPLVLYFDSVDFVYEVTHVVGMELLGGGSLLM